MEYLVVIEKTKTGFSAYVPDIPGCIATAPTKARVLTKIKEAIKFHLEGLTKFGMKIPKPKSQVAFVEVKLER